MIEANGSLPFAMLPSALSVSPLVGNSVHRMRSVFSDYLRRCNLRIGLSSLRVDQVRNCAVAFRDPKRSGKKPWRIYTTLVRHLRGVAALCQDHNLLFSFADLPPLSLSKLPPPALRADACCREDRRPLQLSTGGEAAPRVCELRPPPLVSWRSWHPSGLSFPHDA